MLLAVSLLAACDYKDPTPQQLPYNNLQVQELLRATDAASAFRFGFTSVDTNSDIRLEVAPSGSVYDRMLHIGGRTTRTISFKREADGFRWTGEQEIYTGPNKYQTPDGSFFETISFTYELLPVAHYRTNHLNVQYSGDDARLDRWGDLKVEAVLPVLKEWGYSVEHRRVYCCGARRERTSRWPVS
jgi:hypothetical protein